MENPSKNPRQPSSPGIPDLSSGLKGKTFYFVGIKGTGMAALAELFHFQGARVSGSDGTEKFYTDAVLNRLGIPFAEGFDEANVPRVLDGAVYSAAYDPETHPELILLHRRGIPLFVYPEALGLVSRLHSSTGIAGVHGKTTTTALTGTLLQEMDLPVSVLVGSSVPGLGGEEEGRSTLVKGDRFFVAETCEYRRHFLHFYPRRILLTSVEADHLDYFKDEEDVKTAFLEYIDRLPQGGELIYCADDPGAAETVRLSVADRPDLSLIPYGFTAEGTYRVHREPGGASRFRLAGFDTSFELRVPGEHTILDAAGALAVAEGIRRDHDPAGSLDEAAARRGLLSFRGSRRRAEIIGEAADILVMDDYGHHPTAIRKTLAGLKEFYPGRRLVVDFMSHTYSRTAALFEDFAAAFSQADFRIFHPIYASAREKNPGNITGRALAERVREREGQALYAGDPAEAASLVMPHLRAGDLFLTLGAGNNWILGREILRRLQTEGLPIGNESRKIDQEQEL